MTIYQLKFRRVEDGEAAYSYYFKSLETALEYVSNNFWFRGQSKNKFMDEVKGNCSTITFFPDFEDIARSAGRSTYPYYIRGLDVI